MKYTVIWTPNAERELTALWLRSRLRYLITQAAGRVDKSLARDPKTLGESRDANRRIAFVSPLVVEFEVVDERRTVFVRAVRELRDGPVA